MQGFRDSVIEDLSLRFWRRRLLWAVSEAVHVTDVLARTPPALGVLRRKNRIEQTIDRALVVVPKPKFAEEEFDDVDHDDDAEINTLRI